MKAELKRRFWGWLIVTLVGVGIILVAGSITLQHRAAPPHVQIIWQTGPHVTPNAPSPAR